ALFLLGFRLLRRRLQIAPSPHHPPHLQPATLLHTVALYRALERALAARGVPRQTSTPPLGHARALLHLGHPQATEILALTEVYLEARFGMRQLDDTERREYLRRVKALRLSHQPPLG
ncbi:MAG: DUF4129 domain-containing protein, partial [Polyangiaceae bacterium]|nr:DUF4129 domain-containing protein [Polyangiaceae bacterium]